MPMYGLCFKAMGCISETPSSFNMPDSKRGLCSYSRFALNGYLFCRHNSVVLCILCGTASFKTVRKSKHKYVYLFSILMLQYLFQHIGDVFTINQV